MIHMHSSPLGETIMTWVCLIGINKTTILTYPKNLLALGSRMVVPRVARIPNDPAHYGEPRKPEQLIPAVVKHFVKQLADE
jgi:hypothetical protein